ncbi:MAG TPA: 1-deoxy-D-xylulose-5-phosphate synthase [Acidobacteriota bacterium]|jgi:1-deoxy-D-xylulose-5-phosphate synthase|nr:1-deoxy-D-xylulose-5-phosphate synthase [Acidobacteriota bacterium]
MTDLKFLPLIDTPEDLRKIKKEDLPVVCKELRDLLIYMVSKMGGHLASSLGAIELVVASHYVFNTPEDRLVWDVGHQAYGHKILTGRRDKFHTLRQYEGLSGFLRREESPYDVINAGHAGTSLSFALGMTAARDLLVHDRRIVAIIGDGGLTAGMALEAINQIGHLKKNVIVVLNDNEMSISPNVGALEGYLNRIIHGQVYVRFKKDVEHAMTAIPRVGDKMFQLTKTIVDVMKTFLVPGTFFEELGFQYIGPVNGHDVIALVDAFEQIKMQKGPFLIHAVTVKGKGYVPAEKHPVKWHGSAPFDIEQGVFLKKSSTPPDYTSVFSKTLIRLAREDDKIVAVTAAMPGGTGLDKFAEAFPDRCWDVGIAEQHAVTFCAGMALEGLKPVAAIYSTFLQRAYDQIVHDVCLMDIPVAFCLDRAGLVGQDGTTHHGIYDLAYLRTLPNMHVMAPKDENELQHMIKTVIECPHPAAVRYPRGAGYGVLLDEEIHTLAIGKGEQLREGKDLALVALGSMVYPAMSAAEMLAKDGIDAGVINARFVKPLDEALILSAAAQTGILITLEDHSEHGGFSSAVLELLVDRNLFHVKVLRIAVPDRIITHGPPNLLSAKYGLDADGIFQRTRAFLDECKNQKLDSTNYLLRADLLKVVKKPTP